LPNSALSAEPIVLDALRLSVGTLTIVPAGTIAEIDRRTAAVAMIIAPLAVLPLAVAVALVGGLARTVGLPALAVGLLVVGGLALGSRALHLDGLADTVDGFGSGWTELSGTARATDARSAARERSLMVMRRGDVGPMGVVALIILLGLQAVSVGELIHGVPGALLVGAAVCCSRAALCLTCLRSVPAARGDGLGLAVAGSVPRPAAAACWLAVVLIMSGAAWLAGHSPASGALAALAAALVVALLVHGCVRRLGGVTGDVMGAAIEIAFTVMITVMII
jgi:adenosylcobinamide-GDP ribazoletransferase